MTVALVTGANKGIGFSTAQRLGRLGMKIWLGARCEKRGRTAEAALRLQGIDAQFARLDVTDRDSIEAVACRIRDTSGTLDVLVNNAGIMNEQAEGSAQFIAPSKVPQHLLQAIFATNVMGPIAVIQIMLPLIRRASAGRIVNVSSRLGSFGHQSDANWGPRAINQLGYSTSKAALNMATVMFAYELRDTAIKINAVTPGIVATDLNGLGAAYLAGQPGYATPEAAAELVAQCATLPGDAPSGAFFGPGGRLPW
jgi:NAD(P)-dependent dehydrogenase (short-subunit alcohol dehydrogenase family)